MACIAYLVIEHEWADSNFNEIFSPLTIIANSKYFKKLFTIILTKCNIYYPANFVFLESRYNHDL